MSDVTSRDLYDYIEAEITGLPRSSTGYPVFELEGEREGEKEGGRGKGEEGREGEREIY